MDSDDQSARINSDSIQVEDTVNDTERSHLLAQLEVCQERLATYVDVVADVVERLGHEGNEPGDLLDALGEIEGMLAGKITSEPHDLAGLAEVTRQALWHRDRARLLRDDARNTCEQRAAERDRAILERDAVARTLARSLALLEVTSSCSVDTSHPPQPIVLDMHGVARFKTNTIVDYLLDSGGIDLNQIVAHGFDVDDLRQFYQLIGYSVDGYADLDAGGSDPRLDAFDEAATRLATARRSN